VKDVERSKEFYTKKLGFKLLYDFSPGYVAVLTPNKLQIGLHPFQGGHSRQRSKNQPAGIEIEVNNVDSWYQRLRKRGIRFSREAEGFLGGEGGAFLRP
jgi:catechol 2,3-dioxygenase-like lactoylglutathione lyase family enzyme